MQKCAYITSLANSQNRISPTNSGEEARIVSVDDFHLVFHEVLRPLQGDGASGGLCRGDFHERKNIVEVIRVLHEELSDLPLISEAGDGARFASGTVQRGQKHSREDRDDRNRYYNHLLNIQYSVY